MLFGSNLTLVQIVEKVTSSFVIGHKSAGRMSQSDVTTTVRIENVGLSPRPRKTLNRPSSFLSTWKSPVAGALDCRNADSFVSLSKEIRQKEIVATKKSSKYIFQLQILDFLLFERFWTLYDSGYLKEASSSLFGK
jgi:hypothetical protein